jgi:hypothetical protein
MTSSFTSTDRGARARAGIGLLAALAVGGGACAAPAPEETTAEFVRPSDSIGQNTCTGPMFGPLGRMDTYIVELFDVEPGGTSGETTMDCQRCLGQQPGACQRQHPPICACGSSITADWQSLGPQLEGTRIAGLDQSDIYCMRVTAVDRGASAEPGPTVPCECDPMYLRSDFLMTQARLCALGPPRPVSPLRISLEVRCEGDTGQTGQRGRNVPSFNDCIFPPTPQ